ncbi:SpoIIAA family protein [Fusibacter ferrireducens]|uniref:STAS/SEC14 domain-containing protein n=1 Tax=Fusibacter ferrireducens TaxID=2785058 RepID=A0ABR9ZN30_9FIRM|nr:STAS/SEC14 domain-containing protein [Fusibacter ferrireducens]MBF4691873.1 hypothetical protein [Fusibacter ferrireducens]
MDRFKWDEINGEKILYQDFSNLKKEEVVVLLNQSHEVIEQEGTKGIYVITNINSISFDRNTTRVFEEVSAQNKSYVKASALYGVGTWQRVAIEAVGKLTGREFSIFKTEEEAKKWLRTLNAYK